MARGAAKSESMLSCYLQRELLEVHLKGQTKEAVIDELLGLLESQGFLKDAEQVRAEVLERESQMATGLQHGIAIPHARTDAVDKLVCAVGIKRDGIDFGSMDSEPARIIILTLSPKAAAAPHVQIMAMISRALDEHGRTKALAAGTREELRKALVGQ